MPSLPRFGHFPARKTAAGKLAFSPPRPPQPSWVLLHKMCELSQFYCHGLSQEKLRFWTIFPQIDGPIRGTDPPVRLSKMPLPREASDLIFKIRSCTVRSDLKNKVFFSAIFVHIFKIRSCTVRSDLRNKIARFSGYLQRSVKYCRLGLEPQIEHFFFSDFWGAAGISPAKCQGVPPKQCLISLVSRDIPNF